MTRLLGSCKNIILQWQRKQIKQYCKKHNFGNSLPANSKQYVHLLYDDGKKIIYCFVPKVGCSKWKYTFLLLNGIFPLSTRHKRLTETQLSKSKSLSKLPPEKRNKRLTEYFKFLFVRNPMERVVSAYLDKIGKTVNVTQIKSGLFERLKSTILNKFRPTEYNAWVKNGEIGPMYPTFSEYVQFLIKQNIKTINEHFQPVISLCHPCAIDFNFYGNFKNLPDEAETLLNTLKINSSLYYDREGSYISHKGHKTSEVVTKYFSKLTDQQKISLFNVYKEELDFYYTLYPEESDSHLRL